MLPKLFQTESNQPTSAIDIKPDADLECSFCGRKIKPIKSFGYISKENFSENISCDNCLKINHSSIAFFDQYDFYVKRKKNGWIDALVNELRQNKPD